QVRQAQNALANAQRAAGAGPEGTSTDFTALENAVTASRAVLAAEEQSMDRTHLRAPFDGTVVSVRALVGEATTPSRAVAVMAKPGAPIVKVDLDDDQAAHIAAG